ncbi:MAG: transcriptional coactivator p15/PC4 family protein [Acidobacteriota bacterium]|nr:transcriptional coactivator p15/PC4 family protein [Acidobacteriota bacterium]
MDRVLITMKKNSRDEIRISLSDFGGRLILNIRVFYPGPDGELLPGRQGIAFTIDKLPIFLNALHEAAELLEDDDNELETDEAEE